MESGISGFTFLCQAIIYSFNAIHLLHSYELLIPIIIIDNKQCIYIYIYALFIVNYYDGD